MKSINGTKLMGLGLVSLCALTLGAPSVFAVDPEADTKADVKFVEDTEAMDPEKPEVTDPTNPDGTPGNVLPGGEGSGGNGKKSFNINWVSHFKFGEIKIAGQTMSAFAQPTTLNWADEGMVATGDKTAGLANFLQVTDNTGSNAGWHVTVKGTPFYELDGENKEIPANTLAGAELFLTEPQIIGATGNDALAPASSLLGTTDLLNGAGSHNVLEAANQKGQATWSLTWGAQADKTTLKGITVAGNTATGKATSGVELSVPVTAQPKADKNYRSTLQWTLVSGPQK